LIDDFIGDGKGSCVKDDDPCGDQCINGKKFCLATNSCLRSSSSCDCPRDKWPAENCGPVEKCRYLLHRRGIVLIRHIYFC